MRSWLLAIFLAVAPGAGVHAAEPLGTPTPQIVEACFAAREDLSATVARLEAGGWERLAPGDFDALARALSEFGHLGTLHPNVLETSGAAQIAERTAQIRADVPATRQRIERDFADAGAVDLRAGRAVLKTAAPQRFLILNMRPPIQVCVAISAVDHADPEALLTEIPQFEDDLERRLPDHEILPELAGLDGPMVTLNVDGLGPPDGQLLPSGFLYILRPETIAELSDYVFWTGHVIGIKFQNLP